MHIMKTSLDTYAVAMTETEYAIIGAALEEARSVVNGSPSQDAEEERLTTKINDMTTEWERGR